MSPRLAFVLVLSIGCSGPSSRIVSEARPTEPEPEEVAVEEPPTEQPEIVELASGREHTCARRSDGIVVCWGGNSARQLGRTTERREGLPPMAVPDVVAVEIAAGDSHTCARREDGRVVCWGANTQGELGDGTAERREAPVLVQGLEDVAQIAASSWHTCARRRDGSVLCWGDNDLGELGDGTTTGRRVPTPVRGLVATSIATGRDHSCAILEGGHVACWGQGEYGQLGDGRHRDTRSPVTIENLSGVVELALGALSTCARRENGTVACWGHSESGQLGNASNHSSGTPLDVPNVADVVELASGDFRTCARHEDGSVTCWGGGELGDGQPHDVFDARPPRQVVGLSDARALSLSGSFTCAARETGAVVCWGFNRRGQLGDGTIESRRAPVAVLGLEGATTFVEEPPEPEPEPPPTIAVPSVLDEATAAGCCAREEGVDESELVERCRQGAAERGDLRAAYLHQRLRAQQCYGIPSCVATALRLALAFQDDEPTRALLAEAERLDPPCRDGGAPEGVRPDDVEGSSDITFYRRNGWYHVTDGTRDCLIRDLQMPRRVERVGERVVIHHGDMSAGHDEGCTYSEWEDFVTVADFERGQLLTVRIAGGGDVECADEPSHPSPRGGRVSVTARGDTVQIGRAPRGESAEAPERWLVGRTLTLRDGVYELPRR